MTQATSTRGPALAARSLITAAALAVLAACGSTAAPSGGAAPSAPTRGAGSEAQLVARRR